MTKGQLRLLMTTTKQQRRPKEIKSHQHTNKNPMRSMRTKRQWFPKAKKILLQLHHRIIKKRQLATKHYKKLLRIIKTRRKPKSKRKSQLATKKTKERHHRSKTIGKDHKTRRRIALKHQQIVQKVNRQQRLLLARILSNAGTIPWPRSMSWCRCRLARAPGTSSSSACGPSLAQVTPSCCRYKCPRALWKGPASG